MIKATKKAPENPGAKTKTTSSPPPDFPEPERKPLVELDTKMVQLGELGPRLPIGITVAGKYQRNFELVPFRFKQERAIGNARARIRGLTVGRYVMEILSVLAKSIGPHNIEGMNSKERLLTIGMMHLGDVQMMYVWARLEAIGQELPMSLECPTCRYKYEFTANLNDLDVLILNPDEETDLEFDYELRDGLEVRGEVRHWIRCGPVAWAALDIPDVSHENALANPATRESAVIRGAVKGVEGIDGPVTLTRGDIDGFSKWDKEGLIVVLADRMPGPRLIVEDECPKCQADLFQMMPWTFETFFTRSSRLPTKMGY